MKPRFKTNLSWQEVKRVFCVNRDAVKEFEEKFAS